MVTTRRTKRTMTLRNFTTRTLHTTPTIRVDIGSRTCTTMNPVIHYRKDSRPSRLGRKLKKSLTMLPRSSTLRLPLGLRGTWTSEYQYLGLLVFRENRSPRSLRAWRYQQGRRLWTQVRTSSVERALVGTSCMLTFMITNFREAGRDVSVASYAVPSSSLYSLSQPFFLPSLWCVCLPCLVIFSSFQFPVDTTPKYHHWR